MSKKKTWDQVVTPKVVEPEEPDPEDRATPRGWRGKSGLVGQEADTIYEQIQPMETRNELIAPGPERDLSREEEETIQAAFAPKPSEESPEEKTARLDREDAAVRASIPMFNGVPIPENHRLTREQLENNPSDYHPPDETFVPPVRIEEEPLPNPSVMQIAPKPAPTTTDERQQWFCLQDDGIRTRHPVFGSNAHLIEQMVACPVCGNTHVRRVEPGEPIDDFSLLDWQAQRDRERERLALPRR